MIEFFRSGGVMMWPLLAVAVIVAVMTVRAGLRVHRDPAGPAGPEHLQSIVFWGAVALALGALGTVVGVMQMATVVSRLPEASPALIWGGVSVTMVTLITGLLVFIVALIAWYAIRGWMLRQQPA